MQKFIIFIVCIVFIFSITGCRTTPGAGVESLDEARILAAVNAERNRWSAELSQELTDGLGEVDQRIDNVEDGLQQIIVAAREYRQIVLRIIERLSEVENTE